MATAKLAPNLLQLTKYRVVSNLQTETIRTDRRAAQADVQILKDIVRRHAWIEEE